MQEAGVSCHTSAQEQKQYWARRPANQFLGEVWVNERG